MEAIKSFLENIFASPHYAYGWLVLAALAFLPAIVSGNIIQQDLSKFFNGQTSLNQTVIPLLLNLAILILCLGVIGYAFYLYIWI